MLFSPGATRTKLGSSLKLSFCFLPVVSPQNINKHVKTSVDSMSGRIHYIAPESGEFLSLATIITMVIRLFAR